MNYELAECELAERVAECELAECVAERVAEREDAYVVQCVWCGAKIREDKEDTTGVCLQCFYQMLNNHLESQKRSPYGDFVSDR